MSYLIGKQYVFPVPEADSTPECSILEVTSYVVEVQLHAEHLTGPGFVTDFGDLVAFKEYLHSHNGRHAARQALTDDQPLRGLTQHLRAWFRTHIEPSIAGSLATLTVWPSSTPWHTLLRQVTFAAGHHLDGLPAEHKCSRPHGHTYHAEVLLSPQAEMATLTTLGPSLTTFRDWVQTQFDHRVLNDHLDVAPTCEALARITAKWWQQQPEPCRVGVTGVRVWESPTSWSEYPVEGSTT